MNPLRFHRLEKKLSQLQLGVKSKVWPSRISYFENHLLPAREGEKRKLARTLGVSVTELFPENTNDKTHPGSEQQG